MGTVEVIVVVVVELTPINTVVDRVLVVDELPAITVDLESVGLFVFIP